MKIAFSSLLFLFAGLVAMPSDAQLIYLETFPVAENQVGRGEESRQQGWEVIGRGQSGDSIFTMVDPGTPLPAPLAYVTSGAGINADGGEPAEPGIGNMPVGTLVSDGTLFASRGFAPHLFFTEEVPAGTMSGDVNRLVVEARNNSINANQAGSQVIRAALKVGGVWYASNESFTDTDGVVSLTNLDLSEANWDIVTVTQLDTVGLTSLDGVTFSNAFDQALPAGAVEAWGVFNQNLTNNTRFDSIGFSTIPEPTTALLAGLGLAGLVSARRRR